MATQWNFSIMAVTRQHRLCPGVITALADLDISCQRINLSAMKAVSINISLNPELAEFAREDSRAKAYDSMSEYMRDLIRKRRQEEITADVAFLEKSTAGAPSGDPSDTEMAEIIKAQHRIRNRKNRARCP
jgi:Arc/MetJ-type ribon-helix-helix transcriptional regulator